MTQVQLLKINSNGFQEEHGAADDITFATVTAATQLAVTSGVTITNNISFNAVTDTIAGIQNQNLVDKTATETISGNWTIATGYKLTLIDAPVSGTDAVNKNYVSSLFNGLDWQESVIARQVDATLNPGATPPTGARYILTDVGNLHANFGTITGVGNNDIVQYSGTAFVVVWDASAAQAEGGAAWVEAEDIVYFFTSTSWVKLSSVTDHNSLSGLQGGTTNQYYHMTSAQNTWIGAAVTKVPTGSNIAGINNNETITGNWTFNDAVDVANGEFTFPNAASAIPAEGDSYWDGATDTLYVYNGSAWVDITAGGSASYIGTTYTAGAGGISQYNAVYISAADTILKADADAFSTSKVIGFARNTASAGNNVTVQENGVLTGILSGAGTAGDPYFLSGTAGAISTARPTGAGKVVYKVGYAKNSNDLHIQLEFVGIRS